MPYLKTSEAAALLAVGQNTLRTWERRFGFPNPQRSPGGHRFFSRGEVLALRAALQDGLSISSAVARARAGLASDTHSLVGALFAYDGERADRAMETALALRSVERSVEELLLPGLEQIAARVGDESAAWAFSVRWAASWLGRAKRLAPPQVSGMSILLGDGSQDELDLDAAYIRALELFCVRAGVRVLRLSARAVGGLADAASVHRPNVIVLAGRDATDVIVARWAHLIARSVGPVPLALYRAASGQMSTTALPAPVGEAHRLVLSLTDTSLPASGLRLAG